MTAITFDRSTLPASIYDRIATDAHSDRGAIFTWSTPADPTATPWRVSWPSRLHALVRACHTEAAANAYPDLYVDYHSDRGERRTLEVMLRDNRNQVAHRERLTALASLLRSRGVRVSPMLEQGFLLVLDDLRSEPRG